MDLVTDRLESGRPFRVLTVLDQLSRECPLLEPGVSMTGKAVARTLERLSFDRASKPPVFGARVTVTESSY